MVRRADPACLGAEVHRSLRTRIVEPGMTEPAGRGIPEGTDPREDRLVRLLSEYLDRLNAGEEPSAERIRAEHPDLAEDLLRELETFRGIGKRPAPDGPPSRLGSYRIVRQLGRGGMGIVYEAWDESMDRRVALKVLPADLLESPRAVARFIQEARVAGKLQHPHIVGVHGMGIDAGRPYFAMEFVQGETLNRIHERRPPGDRISAAAGEGVESATGSLASFASLLEETENLETSPGTWAPGDPAVGGEAAPPGRVDAAPVEQGHARRIAWAFASLADALHHAHGRGVIHRDIKPSNIILDSSGRLRILDFGLARLEGQESLTLSRDLLGTPLYMSPEQAAGRNSLLDRRTDIYSLGATLYEALVRRPPSQGRDHPETLAQIIHQDPPPPRLLNPRLPRDLETIVLKCLRKDPGSRYATAEALAQDLRRFARGEPIEARPQSRVERIARRLRRRKALTAFAAALVLLIGATAVLVRGYLEDAHRSRKERYEDLVLEAMMRLEYAKGRPPPALDPLVPPEAGGGGLRERLSARLDGVAFAQMVGGEEARLDPLLEALERLEEAMGIFPGGADASYRLAQALDLLGRRKQALEALDSILERDPSFAPARILLASAGERAGGAAEGAAEPETATSRPSTWEEALLLVHRLQERREWERAIEVYTVLLAHFRRIGDPYLGAMLEAHLGRGVARRKAGRLEEAIEDFAAVRALEPRALEPFLLLAMVYHAKGKREEALARFEELFDIAPFKGEAASRIASALHDLKEDEAALDWAERIEDPVQREVQRAHCLLALRREGAIEAARSAVRIAPADDRALRALGAVLLEEGKAEEAAIRLREAVARNPGSAASWNQLARALLDLDDLEGAFRALEESLKVDPRDPRTRSLMGLAYLDRGDFPAAEESFRKALELDPEDLSATNNLGILRARQKDYDAAVLLFETCIRLDRGMLQGHSNLGWMRMRQGRYEEARAACVRALELNPRFHRAWIVIGASRFHEGDFDAALEAYTKAVDLGPGDALAHFERGVTLERLDRPEEAAASYTRGIEARRPDIRAAFNLGNLHYARGKIPEAIAAFRRALEIDPDHEPSHTNLGEVLIQARDLEQAEAHSRRAMEIDPSSADGFLNLAIIQERAGRLEEAVRTLRTSAGNSPRDPRPLLEISRLLREASKPREALEASRQAVNLLEVHFQKVPGSRPIREDLLRALDSAALAAREAGDEAQAREAAARSISLRREAAGKESAASEELNDLARALLTIEPPDLKNPGEALEFARRAVEISGGEDPTILDILALAQFETGALDEAVRTERRALALLPSSSEPALQARKEMEERLARFEEAVRGKSERGAAGPP